jgi:hypothetical protein
MIVGLNAVIQQGLVISFQSDDSGSDDLRHAAGPGRRNDQTGPELEKPWFD